ncbi:FAD-dependent oxidoreductase [Nocardioides zeae]
MAGNETDYDVVVIGGGGAGLAAAVSAAERGASVILFESEGELGGSTQLSAGLFTAAATSVQQQLGVDDTVDRFFQHYMDLNQWLLKPGLVRRFCELAGPTLEWMLELGLEVPAQISGNAHQPGLCRAGVEDVWRGHVPKDQGYGLVQVLDRARRAHGIDAVLHTRVERLLVDTTTERPRVTGVVADGVELTAGAVVVATGGLAQDRALVERWFPDALRAGESLFVVAAEGSRGDHLGFGEQVAAAVAGDGWGLMLPTAEFVRHHHWQAGFPPPRGCTSTPRAAGSWTRTPTTPCPAVSSRPRTGPRGWCSTRPPARRSRAGTPTGTPSASSSSSGPARSGAPTTSPRSPTTSACPPSTCGPPSTGGTPSCPTAATSTSSATRRWQPRGSRPPRARRRTALLRDPRAPDRAGLHPRRSRDRHLRCRPRRGIPADPGSVRRG